MDAAAQQRVCSSVLLAAMAANQLVLSNAFGIKAPGAFSRRSQVQNVMHKHLWCCHREAGPSDARSSLAACNCIAVWLRVPLTRVATARAASTARSPYAAAGGCLIDRLCAFAWRRQCLWSIIQSPRARRFTFLHNATSFNACHLAMV